MTEPEHKPSVMPIAIALGVVGVLLIVMVLSRLIKGDDVLEKIATTPTEGPDRPVKRINIVSIKIVPADSVK